MRAVGLGSKVLRSKYVHVLFSCLVSCSLCSWFSSHWTRANASRHAMSIGHPLSVSRVYISEKLSPSGEGGSGLGVGLFMGSSAVTAGPSLGNKFMFPRFTLCGRKGFVVSQPHWRRPLQNPRLALPSWIGWRVPVNAANKAEVMHWFLHVLFFPSFFFSGCTGIALRLMSATPNTSAPRASMAMPQRIRNVVMGSRSHKRDF